MSSYRISPLRAAAACLLIFAWLAFSPQAYKASSATDKLKPEEIVAKHLESIGTTQARKAIKSIVIVGSSEVEFHNPGKGRAVGQTVIASEGNKLLIGMAFENTNYPYEKLGFDGSGITVSFLRPGQRSTLGDFLHTNDFIFKQGLMGGTLSSAWPLLDADIKHARLESGGIKKVNDRDAYTIKYLPRGGSDMEVTLFFDKETFQHVRTEYVRTITAGLGANPAGAPRQTQNETHYRMVEDFSDFKKEGDLTLPHTYKITLSLGGRSGAMTFLADWTLSLSKFDFNVPIDGKSFNVS
ncbi:MAG: hypothetical protein DMF68_05170 [Acidobacteria bacterium]|nr:MAG: hypothetical protein DMF68_05170 [Acidobacteriota bacterium]